MKEKIQYLKTSPVYAMLLGSKELFHSNFWHWLMTCEDIKPKNTFVNIFFNLQNIDKIEREQQHRDLTIWQNNVAYVVENKIKSVPYKEQLKEYENNLEKRQSFGLGILTGIFKPDFMKDNDCNKWTFVSYKEIGERILKTLKEVKCSEFNKLIIEEYANVVLNIYNIINEKLLMTKNLIQNNDCKDLEEIRLDDICKKYSAEKFSKYLKQRIYNELESLLRDKSNCRLVISSDFTRKSSYNDFRVCVNERDVQRKLEIGIQIQNGEYRISAVKFGKIDNQMVFDEFLKKGWFFPVDRIGNERFINGKHTSLRKKENFCKYETPGDAGYHFVYQYWNIKDYSFEFLCNEIYKDMKKAIDIVNNILQQ